MCARTHTHAHTHMHTHIHTHTHAHTHSHTHMHTHSRTHMHHTFTHTHSHTHIHTHTHSPGERLACTWLDCHERSLYPGWTHLLWKLQCKTKPASWLSGPLLPWRAAAECSGEANWGRQHSKHQAVEEAAQDCVTCPYPSAAGGEVLRNLRPLSVVVESGGWLSCPCATLVSLCWS